jgi:ribosomal protein S18 acetylase RimI-like enzyme
MVANNISYKINKSKYKDIFFHLLDCNDKFIPPLSQRVEINIYAQKISTNADKFEAWQEDTLIGLLAVYCNDIEARKAFITIISVAEKFSNKGIASELLAKCIEYVRVINFEEITLEVSVQSVKARALYEKFGFQEIGQENDEYILMKRKL